MENFNKHYLFVFCFVFVATFLYFSSGYPGKINWVSALFYFLVLFVPMFFFFKKRPSLELKRFNVYMYLGFLLGLFFLSKDIFTLELVSAWTLYGLPFVLIFNFFGFKLERERRG